jgi:hypothetical protein
MDEQAGQDLDLGAAAAPDPAEDPLAGVQSEPIEDVSGAPEEERLGGDGAGIGEPSAHEVLQEPEEPEDLGVPAEPAVVEEAEEEAAEAAAEAAAAEPEPAAEPKPVAEGGAPEEEAKASEPAAKPQASKGSSSKTKKGKSLERSYQVLRLSGKAIEYALDKPIPARNGDDAIKKAYTELAKEDGGTMTLVAIPVGYFKPKKVKGRDKKDYAVVID